jgi:hypothetical protein
MEAQVPAATDTKTARGVFDDLALATPIFPAAMPALRQWIQCWDRSHDHASADLPGVRVAIGLDSIWITLYLGPSRGSPTPGNSV